MSPLALATITAVNRRFNKTGSVEDLTRTDRPATVLTEEKLEEMVDTNPRLSIRQDSIFKHKSISCCYAEIAIKTLSSNSDHRPERR